MARHRCKCYFTLSMILIQYIYNISFLENCDGSICSRSKQRKQLEIMFPNATSVAITHAIERTKTVHEAVDMLLGNATIQVTQHGE